MSVDNIIIYGLAVVFTVVTVYMIISLIKNNAYYKSEAYYNDLLECERIKEGIGNLQKHIAEMENEIEEKGGGVYFAEHNIEYFKRCLENENKKERKLSEKIKVAGILKDI